MTAIHYLRSAGNSLCSAASKIANSILRPSTQTIATAKKVVLFSAVFFSIMQTSEARAKFSLIHLPTDCGCDGRVGLYNLIDGHFEIDFAKMYSSCYYLNDEVDGHFEIDSAEMYGSHYYLGDQVRRVCEAQVDFSCEFFPDSLMRQAIKGFEVFTNYRSNSVMLQAIEGFKVFSNCMSKCISTIEALNSGATDAFIVSFFHLLDESKK